MVHQPDGDCFTLGRQFSLELWIVSFFVVTLNVLRTLSVTISKGEPHAHIFSSNLMARRAGPQAP